MQEETMLRLVVRTSAVNWWKEDVELGRASKPLH